MRAKHAIVKLLVAGVSVAFVAGCDTPNGVQESNPTAGDWQSSIDLESPYGGYRMTDETMAFADPEVLRISALEEAPQPAVADADTMPSDSLFVVRVLWGQLEGNREAKTVVDWTGAVSINHGQLGVLRTIAFEYPADHLVRPRPDRQTLQFVSHTLPAFDGLLLVVHETPGDPTTFSFTTAPYTNTWTLHDLLGANLVIPVDAEGNAVSINAIPLRRHECPSGFARGEWIVREGQPGLFRGAWMNALGDEIGHLRGHFGINAAGEHVWFAKIIGPEGRVIGLARGRWEPNADPATPGGRFAGGFMTRSGVGEIAGRYLPGREGAPGASGFFEARWRLLRCRLGVGDAKSGEMVQPDLGPRIPD